MDDAPPLTARTLEALQSFAALFVRARAGAVAIAASLLVVLAAFDPDVWRRWVLGAAAAVALGLMAVEAWTERGTPGLTPRRVATRVLSVFAIHTGLVAATGGVESPILPLYIPVSVVLAMALGRRRWFALVVGVILATIGCLLALRLAGLPITVPALLRTHPAGPPDPLALTLSAAAVGLIASVGGAIGLLLRGYLDRASRAEAEARADVLTALRAQNRELGELSGRLAHELKNPLAAITGLSALVARKLEPGSREARQMGVMVGEVKRLGTISTPSSTCRVPSRI
ncbi:MAG: hypothetical protein R3F43_12105 [bacterium]